MISFASSGINFANSSQLSITLGGFIQGRASPPAFALGVSPLPWIMIMSTGQEAPIFV
jgi:hypothetical protein